VLIAGDGRAGIGANYLEPTTKDPSSAMSACRFGQDRVSLVCSRCQLAVAREMIGDVPWQQFLDAVDRVLGDVLQDVVQIRFGVETVRTQ
jgi:hypothetical protein